jgi:hypothetical protein
MKSRLRQDKGHRGEWEAIGRSLSAGSGQPITLESLVATSLTTFAAVRALRNGEAESLDARAWLRATLAEPDRGSVEPNAPRPASKREADRSYR